MEARHGGGKWSGTEGPAATHADGASRLWTGDDILYEAIAVLALEILAKECRPMTVGAFARAFWHRCQAAEVEPSAEYGSALQEMIMAMHHARVRYKGPGTAGVGYIYDAAHEDCYPAVLEER